MTRNEIRRLIDEIRAYLNSPDQTNDPRLAETARAYSQACREANERLLRCGELLEKGHRPEAIALAEAEPDLIAVVAALGFPELDFWQEISGNYGWERCQALRSDIASQVNDAYQLQGSLEELLREHRRLALQQAPLSRRLAVLRKLAQQDSVTPFWTEDVEKFEEHRQVELRELADRVAKSLDRSTQGEFLQQFEAENWHSPVSAGLLKSYRSALVDFHTALTLPVLSHRIAASMSTMQVPELMRLRDEWNSLVTKVADHVPGWQPPRQFQSMAGPAFDYLQQEEQQARMAAFGQDVQALRQAMASGAPPAAVEGYLARADSHGIGMPQRVLSELDVYRSGLRDAKVLNVGVILALILTVLGAVVFAFFMLRA